MATTIKNLANASGLVWSAGTPLDMAAAIRAAGGGAAWRGVRLPNGEDVWLLRLPNDRGGICTGGDTAWGDWRGERGAVGTSLLLDEQSDEGEALWYDERGELVEEVESRGEEEEEVTAGERGDWWWAGYRDGERGAASSAPPGGGGTEWEDYNAGYAAGEKEYEARTRLASED